MLDYFGFVRSINTHYKPSIDASSDPALVLQEHVRRIFPSLAPHPAVIADLCVEVRQADHVADMRKLCEVETRQIILQNKKILQVMSYDTAKEFVVDQMMKRYPQYNLATPFYHRLLDLAIFRRLFSLCCNSRDTKEVVFTLTDKMKNRLEGIVNMDADRLAAVVATIDPLRRASIVDCFADDVFEHSFEDAIELVMERIILKHPQVPLSKDICASWVYSCASLLCVEQHVQKRRVMKVINENHKKFAPLDDLAKLTCLLAELARLYPSMEMDEELTGFSARKLM